MSKEDKQSSVKDAVDEVEEVVEKAADKAKEEAADSISTSSTMSSAKDMLESARSWTGAVGSTISKAWSTVGGGNEGEKSELLGGAYIWLGDCCANDFWSNILAP